MDDILHIKYYTFVAANRHALTNIGRACKIQRSDHHIISSSFTPDINFPWGRVYRHNSIMRLLLYNYQTELEE